MEQEYEEVEREEEREVKNNVMLVKKQQFWTKELQGAAKRLRKFKQQGDKVVKRFLDESRGETFGGDSIESYSLNLFHSNIVTLQSMLYGSEPKIEVSREHHDPDDDIARVSGLILQRILQADVDPSGGGVSTVLKSCLQDRLLSGLGIARVRYKANMVEQEVVNPETLEPMTVEVFDSEEAPVDYVHWDDFAWGWGRTWDEIPWIAFKNYLNKDECEDRFGEDIAKTLTYKNQTADQKEESEDDAAEDEKSVGQKAEIWEIWCKSSKKVYWYQAGQPKCLDCKDDPLGLNGFYPVPKPLVANLTTRMFIPRADYVIAQDLYNQIDTLYTRITIITRAIKVVGLYDQASGDSIGRMLKEGKENDLIPVENWAIFAESGGTRGKIDWFPVEQVVGTLQTLRQVLEEQIGLLHQVTGMADIMRGQSQQYAGVGQEQMKAKFGSIRVQALQDEFARFASDLEELRAEVIAKHFELKSISMQAAVQFLPNADKQLVPMALELIKSPMCKWRINIRPETIAMIDYQSLKAERTEYIMAISQYIQSAQAMADKIPESLPVLLEMMKWGVAGFKGANYLEGILDSAINAVTKAQQQAAQNPNQEPSPEQMKMQTEQMRQQTQQMKSQAEMQKIQMKSQADMVALQAKIQGEIQKIQAESQADLTFEQRSHQNKMVQMMQDMNNDLRIIQANLSADMTVESAQAEYDIASKQAEHTMNMREIGASRRGNE